MPTHGSPSAPYDWQLSREQHYDFIYACLRTMVDPSHGRDLDDEALDARDLYRSIALCISRCHRTSRTRATDSSETRIILIPSVAQRSSFETQMLIPGPAIEDTHL